MNNIEKVKELNDLRIIFMGTPEFAVASLDRLVKAGTNIVGVVTTPDKAAGRGMTLQQSPVKKYAVENKLNILQPEKLKDQLFTDALTALHADIQIVVAFRMLPEKVWSMPPMGTVNVHGSLLPQYRGAAPINWAIINGEKFTGITTFKLQHEIDTGNILLSEKIPIGDDEDAGGLHDKMKVAGAELLIRTLQGLADGSLKDIPQSELANAAIEIRHAPKIFTATCLIDWTKPVQQVYDLIRGLSPSPAAFTYMDEKTVKIFKAEKVIGATNHEPGSYDTDKKTYLRFACTDGYINLLELQLQGKKRLTIKDFLRGYHFTS